MNKQLLVKKAELIILLGLMASSGMFAQNFRIRIAPFQRNDTEKKAKEEVKAVEVYQGGVFDWGKLYMEAPPQSYYNSLHWEKANEEKNNFFWKAIAENNTEKAIAFMERGALPCDFLMRSNGEVIGCHGQKSLYPAVANKNYDLLEAVYNKFPDVIKYSQLLHYACSLDFDPKMIEWLIEHGASLNMNGYARYSSHNGYWYARYSWNDDKDIAFRPIDVAFLRGKNETVKYLMEKHNQRVNTLVLSSSLVKMIPGNSDEQLIAAVDKSRTLGYSEYDFINMQDTNKEYPLIKAIKEGKNEFAKYLIAHCGADVNVQRHEKNEARSVGINIGSDFYESPLSIAISKPGNLDIINYLLEHGAKPYKDVIKIYAHKEYREAFILQGLID